MAGIRDKFDQDYGAMLDGVLKRRLTTAVCTIYDARFPNPLRRRLAATGLTIFNPAAPVIEAVRRAGGRILVHGQHLRLRAPTPLPDALIAEVRQHKVEILDLFGTVAPALSERQRPSASPVEISVERWHRGVERLSSMSPPPGYPERVWAQLLTDAERFLDRWGAQAARLGWPTWELFGCHRRAPFGRINGMGLVLLLRGKEVVALTDAEAAIRTTTGAHQTYRRKPHDPLHPTERCLVWELGDA